MSVVLQTGVMHYRENEQDQWHPLIIKAQSIDLEALVDPYEPTVPKTWMQGEYCLQDDKIWRCVNPVTTPADFDEDDWVQTTFGYEIEQIGAGLASEATTRASEDTSIRNTLSLLDAEKADEASLALRRSGTTNTGAQIENGTYFYLDGTLKRAISTIAANADFTAQNCETVTAGGLNDLKDSLIQYQYGDKVFGSSSVTIGTSSWAYSTINVTVPSGYLLIGAIVGTKNDVVYAMCGQVSSSSIAVYAYNRHSSKRTFEQVFAIPLFKKE